MKFILEESDIVPGIILVNKDSKDTFIVVNLHPQFVHTKVSIKPINYKTIDDRSLAWPIERIIKEFEPSKRAGRILYEKI